VSPTSPSVQIQADAVETLLGDASKARAKLGWTPRITFEELVAEMVREDFRLAKRDALLARHGYPQIARYA